MGGLLSRRGKQSRGLCRGRGSPDTEQRGEVVDRRADNGDRDAQSRSNYVRRVSDSGRRSWGLGDGSVAAECWR